MDYNQEEQQMTLRLYQILATSTANPHELALINYGLGIAGEAGEVTDIIKKISFQGHELDKEDLTKELGDVLWYLSNIADLCGINLEDVANRNLLIDLEDDLDALYDESLVVIPKAVNDLVVLWLSESVTTKCILENWEHLGNLPYEDDMALNVALDWIDRNPEKFLTAWITGEYSSLNNEFYRVPVPGTDHKYFYSLDNNHEVEVVKGEGKAKVFTEKAVEEHFSGVGVSMELV